MNLVIIEGLDKTGKTTYTKDMYTNYKKMRLPGGYEFTQELRKYFLEGKIEKQQMIHLIYGEHIAILEKLIYENQHNYVMDRSFISFLVYQKEVLKQCGYYDTYKKLLEDKFEKVKSLYEVKILYFSKQLIHRKDDWLECMDTDILKKSFDELLQQNIYKDCVESVTVVSTNNCK